MILRIIGPFERLYPIFSKAHFIFERSFCNCLTTGITIQQHNGIKDVGELNLINNELIVYTPFASTTNS